MQTKTKWIIGIAVVSIIGAALYFGDSTLQTGKLVRPATRGSPDLIVDSIAFSPEHPEPNQQVTITAVVKNIGTNAAGTNSQTKLRANNQSIMPNQETGRLASNATETESWTYTTGAAGSIPVRVCADTNNDVRGEVNENNNCRDATLSVEAPAIPACNANQYSCAWSTCDASGSQIGSACGVVGFEANCQPPQSPTRPCTPLDVAVSGVPTISPLSPTTATPTITFNANIVNNSRDDVMALNAAVYVDREGTNSLAYIGTSVPMLEPSESYSATFTFNPRPGLLTAGAHTFVVCADDRNRIAEYDELNNCSAPVSFTVTATVQPDLVIDSLTLSQNARGEIFYQAVIKNIGTSNVVQPGGNGPFVTLDSAIVNGIYRANIYSGGNSGSLYWTLAPNATITMTGSIGRGSNGHLIYYGVDYGAISSLTFTIDGQNVITESNETNNSATVSVPPEYLAFVAPADLQIPRFSSVLNIPMPVVENPITFNTTVYNVGSTTAPASFAVLTGTSSTPGDVRIETEVPELAPLTSAPVSFTWTPTVAQIYRYYFNVCADSRNAIAEYNEDNNCDTFGSFTITAAPAPEPALAP